VVVLLLEPVALDLPPVVLELAPEPPPVALPWVLVVCWLPAGWGPTAATR
jgi:hypothetical protein